MTLTTIRELARRAGVKNYSRYRKVALVKEIQKREGNKACFKEISDCGEHGCLWREDCQALRFQAVHD
ncbi:MAG: Rho termination factor N-terminal domain-containing protein [Pseudomonadota bacterium]